MPAASEAGAGAEAEANANARTMCIRVGQPVGRASVFSAEAAAAAEA